MGVFHQADGSAYLEQDNTTALAVVYRPHMTQSSWSKALHDQAVVNSEMSLHLKQTFEAAILTQLYPHSQINIYVQILQVDGGNYGALVNTATLAAVNMGIPLQDYVCASLAGFIKDTPLTDLNYIEEASSSPMLALVLLPKSGQIELQEMNAQLHENHLERIMEATSKACKDVYLVLDQVVREHLQEVTAALGK